MTDYFGKIYQLSRSFLTDVDCSNLKVFYLAIDLIKGFQPQWKSLLKKKPPHMTYETASLGLLRLNYPNQNNSEGLFQHLYPYCFKIFI